MLDWLSGVEAQVVKGRIHLIHITGYGPADVGPHEELRKHVGRGSGLECHHIVEVEHLEAVPTRFSRHDAPSVAIPSGLHRSLVSPRFAGEMVYLGGRRGGMAAVTRKELLELYRAIYTWHTSFRELYVISRNVLR